MEWMTTILTDLVGAYGWVVAPTVLGLAVIISGLAGRLAIWLEDVYLSWVASGVRSR